MNASPHLPATGTRESLTDRLRSDDRLPPAVEANVTSLRPSGAQVIDENSLREAFQLYGGEMLGFARKSLYSDGSGEDAVQETFARAWRSRSRFDPNIGSLRTWLFSIERRVVLDLIARRSKTAASSLDASAEPVSEDQLEAAMLSWQVGSALERLRPDHRTIINELYFNGRSGREVAALLDIPEGTVRSRAFNALRTLRTLLDETGWEL